MAADRSANINVIVPMRNASQTIGTMIQALFAQDLVQPWDLTIVDNGSTDDSVDVVKRELEQAHPDALLAAQVLKLTSPQGHASPRNFGGQSTHAPLLAFCDADDSLHPSWLTATTKALVSHPLVASNYNAGPSAKKDNSTPSGPIMKFGYAVATTNGMGCTRKLFEEIGGFDTYFDSGGADADFSIRASLKSNVTPYQAEDAYYLTGPRTSSRSSLRQGYRFGKGEVRLFHRHIAHHAGSESGPSKIVHRSYSLLRQFTRVRSKPDFITASRELGHACARTVWSVRLRVRFF